MEAAEKALPGYAQFETRRTAVRGDIERTEREVKAERLQVIEGIHAESSARINRRLLGQTVEVLVERENAEGRSTGRTRSGQLVHFDATGLVGQLAQVDVHEVTSWSLSGSLAGSRLLAIL